MFKKVGTYTFRGKTAEPFLDKMSIENKLVLLAIDYQNPQNKQRVPNNSDGEDIENTNVLKEENRSQPEEHLVHVNEFESEREALFDPPLYKQRYLAATEIIKKYQAKSVLDIGCAEGQFLNFIKNFCPFVENIHGVDVDKGLVERNKTRIAPSTIEYLLKRQRPLKICLYQGSIVEPDQRFCNIDVVTCIEVIEHLDKETLKEVPQAIFEKLRPSICIVTTPNSEYNVLFKDFSGKRHWDHKFEWTRQEFENWCETITTIYDYDFDITGVGEPPVGSDVGFCSQAAIFKRKDVLEYLSDMEALSHPYMTEPVNSALRSESPDGHCTYKLIHEVVYPFQNIDTNSKELFLNEISYILNHFYYIDLIDSETYFESDNDIVAMEIKLSELLIFPSIKKFDLSHDLILTYLQEKYELSDDNETLITKVDKKDFQRDSLYFSDDEFFAAADEIDYFDGGPDISQSIIRNIDTGQSQLNESRSNNLDTDVAEDWEF